MTDIVRSGAGLPEPQDVRADLQHFESVVCSYLEVMGLPDTQVFVAVAERQKMLQNIPGVIDGLDGRVLERSHYISKMIAAAAVGLFDAALNYLWDELVNELRRRVAGFDLSYFFDIAAGSSDLRRHLQSEEDLVRIDDASLLRAAREIGLLTAVGFQRLDHIRYMRNHASAAHPNQVELTGLDLAQWLQVCIKEVITTRPDTVTAETGRLLANLKTHILDEGALSAAAAFFDQLPPDRADTLANGLFGLYTDPKRTSTIAENVRRLWAELWPFVGEDTKMSTGVKYARFRASADSAQAEAAKELLDLVDGAAYLPTELRAAEIDRVLDALMSAHHGWDNFYNEGPPARDLARVVGTASAPKEVAPKYVRVLVEVFLGNGYGVSWAAMPIYRDLMEKLEPALARRALRAFMDESISSLLTMAKPRGQWGDLLTILEPKLTQSEDRELLDAIRSFNGAPDQLRLDSAIRRLATDRRSNRDGVPRVKDDHRGG